MCKRLMCVACLGLSLCVLAGTANADLTTGLVGYWPLDGDALDASGNGNDGTIAGAVTPVADRLGAPNAAMNFPGSTSAYINLGQPPMLLIKGAMTVAAWVRADTLSQSGRIIAKQGPSSGRSWGLNLETAGHARFDLGTDPTTRVRADSAPLSFGPTEWWHVAGVFRPGVAVEIYINGVMVKSEPTTVTTQWIENGLPVNIGRRPEPGTPWRGDIDEVFMYNVALAPAEMLRLTTSGIFAFPKARRPDPADGAVREDTWVSLGWTPGTFAVSHDVYLGDSFDDVNAGAGDTFRGNQTQNVYLVGLPGYVYPDGLVAGTTYYWRIDEVNNADPNSPWKGDVWSFSIPPRTAYSPTPADGAESVALNAKLTWTAGYGAKLHTVYFGDSFDDVNNATSGGTLVGATTYSPSPLKSAKVYYWRVDESDPPNMYKGQVWSFTTLGAVHNPYPSNGTAGAEMNAILSWTPSDHAASHQLYFGTNKEAVRKANTTSPEYKGTRALDAESYDPGLLAWDSTYYWRIDEVNNVNPDSPWKGPVWSFTTDGFLMVDGFESCNDMDPPALQSRRIFETWIDGFGTTTNGALVGNDLPPYAEKTIVHSGAQSMPYAYNNNLKYSEATMTLTGIARDWTRQGVGGLSLWFRGVTANAAERMYVAINGTAVVYRTDPAAVQTAAWTEWVIPLQQFANLGVNLANVTSISIGIGTKGNTTAPGGSGKMYFDDIRLYRARTTP